MGLTGCLEVPYNLVVRPNPDASSESSGSTDPGATPNPGNNGENGGNGGTPGTGNLQCYAERFTQPDQQTIRAVDLLFVIDTSQSMDDNKKTVVNGIGAYIAKIPAGTDVQIAVMMGHGSTSKYSGMIYNDKNHPAVLSNRTMSVADIQNHLRANMMNIISDYDTDGGEEGLYSFLKGITTNLAANRAKGFFRQDAALATIFVADENDICAQYPAGVNPVPDYDGIEVKAKARDCKGISPQGILAAVKTLQGTRPYMFGGVLYDDLAHPPHAGEDEYGWGYIDLIKLANGLTVNIAQTDYSAGLAAIGEMSATKLLISLDYELGKTNVDPQTIRVTVDGLPQTHSYSPSTNEIHLSYGGVARSVVDVSYCTNSTPQNPPCTDIGCTGGGVIGI